MLQALVDAGFMTNMRKSKFCQPAAKVVGVHITRQMYTVIDKPIIKLFGSQPPRTLRQVQKLVGQIAHIHKYVPGCSILAKPISDLLKGGKEAKWTSDCAAARNKICKILAKRL